MRHNVLYSDFFSFGTEFNIDKYLSKKLITLYKQEIKTMTVASVNGHLTDRLPETYGSLLDKFFTNGLTAKRNLAKFHPQVDAIETQKEFRIEVALPGFRREDIQLDFQEGKLTISGERKFDTENKENKYHFIETNYGRFSRSFFLPDNINEAAIEAQFLNGLLSVVVPKDEKKVLKRQIEVK